MKTMLTALASTFLLIGSAYAQSPDSPAAATSDAHVSRAMMKSDARRDMNVEKHIKELHAKLQITAAEEPQWDEVAKTMRDNAQQLDAVIDKREGTHNRATAVEDLDAYGEIVQTHADSVKKMSTAFAPLYASMSDRQKKLADEVFAHRAHEGKKSHSAMK